MDPDYTAFLARLAGSSDPTTREQARAALDKVDEGAAGDYRARHLIRWYEHGAGAVQIAWGAPGDFDRCVALATDHAGDQMTPGEIRGFCANRHHAALGIWPATHAAQERHGKVDKFDPAETRDLTGRWTSGGNTTTVTAPKPTAQQRQATAAQARQQARDARAADLAEVAQVQQRLAATRSTSTANTGAAVAAERKNMGIPTGKHFTQLPAARQQAAKQVLAAARNAAKSNASVQRAQAALDAVTKELAATGLRASTRAWLQNQATKATVKLAAARAQQKAAAKQLGAARAAWQHH